ncbi:MAG: recombinase family protein [Patescibacteria group bacterium]
MKSVIFCRVSSREQQEGFSLDSQKRLLVEYAQRQDFKVIKTFMVAESASKIDERKIFQEMLAYVAKKGIQHILVEKVDRITRSLQDAVKIDNWRNIEGNHVHFVKDSLTLHKTSRSSDILQWDIKVVFARQYINNLREETTKGQLEKARQGHYPGNSKRGYITVRENGSRRATWMIDDSPTSESKYITKAFELYATTDKSLSTIRQELFEEGWKRKNGKPIPKSQLANLLKDSFYTGESFFWCGKKYAALHQGIVRLDIFNRVQGRFEQKRNGVKQNKYSHLLKGLMTCTACGRAITAEIQKGHTYYRCTGHDGCGQKSIYTREEDLEQQLMEALGTIEIHDHEFLEWLKDAMKESFQEKTNFQKDALNNLKIQSDRLQQRLDNLYIDKLDGVITKIKFEELSCKYRSEQEYILKKVESHNASDEKYFELGSKLIDFASEARNLYLSKEKEQKRNILRFAFLNLQLQDRKLQFALHPALFWIQKEPSVKRVPFGCGDRI